MRVSIAGGWDPRPTAPKDNRTPTDAAFFLAMDLSMQGGSLWENEWRERFARRKRRQIQRRRG